MDDDAPIVFVVDDDPSVRKGLARLLRAHGYAVDTCASAMEYLARPTHGRTACLILDIRMPELSGSELQHRLNAAGNDIPILFLTAHGDIPMSVKAIKAGAFDFLTKPVDELTLCAAVASALSEHAKIRELHQAREDSCRQLETLTPREVEVMRCVISGARNKQIGAHLGITEKTVKVHRARVIEKLGVGSVADLAVLCASLGVKPQSCL